MPVQNLFDLEGSRRQILYELEAEPRKLSGTKNIRSLI